MCQFNFSATRVALLFSWDRDFFIMVVNVYSEIKILLVYFQI
uniref:Uncharacterized protein n=1 Tax=Coptotermes formosanus TaxID=36987 RepID=R4V2U1_COPFO|nr:hypothetical protein [Coptotermes formosanus]